MKINNCKYSAFCCALSLAMLAMGCKKQNEFLDAKPNQSLVVPATLSDYQALLNNTNIFNGDDPELGELSTDDFYITPAVFINLSATERNCYTWAKQIYNAGITPGDWSVPYQQIYYANTVLDALPGITYAASQQGVYNQLKGTALFFRSYAFYNLVQTFALPYDPGTSATDPGIPLRLKADITVKSVRAPVQTCYDQVIADLKLALPLLPLKTPSPTQPSQVAVNAMLARVYLAMSNYTQAMFYANACLAQYPDLVDYNTLTTPTTTSVNSSFIAEDIFHSSLYSYVSLGLRRNSVVDSALYAAYSNNDLRKTKFFSFLENPPLYPRFVGSYDYRGYRYDGLATDEIYLIRAECFARAGNASSAINDLNTLLINRWATGTFIPYTAATAGDALNQVLMERRKELLYRGLRWTDLRRLNKEDQFKITLERNLNGVIYTLPPNDPRYALPLPDAEINISGLTQNQR